jgi:myo-inositol-1-phosphate synthase
MNSIRVVIIGVGNCASALVQGITLSKYEKLRGLTFEEIGGYKASNIDFVGAYDVDERKVGKPLGEALFEKPNCCYPICAYYTRNDNELNKIIVNQGPRFDGVAPHMLKENADVSFRPLPDVYDSIQIKADLIAMNADVLINYLPVGSKMATEFWANMCFLTLGLRYNSKFATLFIK